MYVVEHVQAGGAQCPWAVCLRLARVGDGMGWGLGRVGVVLVVLPGGAARASWSFGGG
jgi:hypothetical protein